MNGKLVGDETHSLMLFSRHPTERDIKETRMSRLSGVSDGTAASDSRQKRETKNITCEEP